MNRMSDRHAVSQAYIGLGSNLDNPASQIRKAFEELARLPSSHLLAHSSLYRSAPMGHTDQPDFINAVALIETALAPHDLLKALLEIEHLHGRVREYLNAPRTLDLDILMYDGLQWDEDCLILPHPRMHQRAFVLQPLREIAPDCHIPGRGSIAELLAACAGQQVEREQAQ
ncbi:2-amino-4-hydroxy-6-hydroxymethyldihydropteridine diphosphokinase [Nitrosospira sp. Nsp1]|uniref:2-amino-4-hydroxy-6- hydroxymethyldihydropteridine diphosphokinase n=1 Tax=Nitrosospira sp. Nsp1 TaxID=136547 RepID=UPI00088B2F02|nr:2-amino-4-hydroxy-6-hydroxymethyldihydropteridine diphosphokinase [Nitrosospira sp. Nsp1]SCX62871.1 2-amino-4-hydroxy-6-hydroxymethyldihydropteridinediphosphokinase [Nitrosospira sp. Nsp1]